MSIIVPNNLLYLFAPLASKMYLKPNLGVQNEPCVQNGIFRFLLKKCKGTAMQFKKQDYDCFDMKTKPVKISRCV